MTKILEETINLRTYKKITIKNDGYYNLVYDTPLIAKTEGNDDMASQNAQKEILATLKVKKSRILYIRTFRLPAIIKHSLEKNKKNEMERQEKEKDREEFMELKNGSEYSNCSRSRRSSRRCNKHLLSSYSENSRKEKSRESKESKETKQSKIKIKENSIKILKHEIKPVTSVMIFQISFINDFFPIQNNFFDYNEFNEENEKLNLNYIKDKQKEEKKEYYSLEIKMDFSGKKHEKIVASENLIHSLAQKRYNSSFYDSIVYNSNFNQCEREYNKNKELMGLQDKINSNHNFNGNNFSDSNNEKEKENENLFVNFGFNKRYNNSFKSINSINLLKNEEKIEEAGELLNLNLKEEKDYYYDDLEFDREQSNASLIVIKNNSSIKKKQMINRKLKEKQETEIKNHDCSTRSTNNNLNTQSNIEIQFNFEKEGGDYSNNNNKKDELEIKCIIPVITTNKEKNNTKIKKNKELEILDEKNKENIKGFIDYFKKSSKLKNKIGQINEKYQKSNEEPRKNSFHSMEKINRNKTETEIPSTVKSKRGRKRKIQQNMDDIGKVENNKDGNGNNSQIIKNIKLLGKIKLEEKDEKKLNTSLKKEKVVSEYSLRKNKTENSNKFNPNIEKIINKEEKEIETARRDCSRNKKKEENPEKLLSKKNEETKKLLNSKIKNHTNLNSYESTLRKLRSREISIKERKLSKQSRQSKISKKSKKSKQSKIKEKGKQIPSTTESKVETPKKSILRTKILSNKELYSKFMQFTPSNTDDLNNLNNLVLSKNNSINGQKIDKAKEEEKTAMLSMKPKNECNICLEKIKEKAILEPCMHYFCKECIENWAKNSTYCPLCKIHFKRIDFGKRKTLCFKAKKFQYDDYDEEEENWYRGLLEYCMICKGTHEDYNMLVCEKCNKNVCHYYCDGLESLPAMTDNWFCLDCRKAELNNSHNSLRSQRRNQISSIQDESKEKGKNNRTKSKKIHKREKINGRRKLSFNFRKKQEIKVNRRSLRLKSMPSSSQKNTRKNENNLSNFNLKSNRKMTTRKYK